LKDVFCHFGIPQQIAYEVAQGPTVSLNEFGEGIPVTDLTAKQQHLFYQFVAWAHAVPSIYKDARRANVFKRLQILLEIAWLNLSIYRIEILIPGEPSSPNGGSWPQRANMAVWKLLLPLGQAASFYASFSWLDCSLQAIGFC